MTRPPDDRGAVPPGSAPTPHAPPAATLDEPPPFLGTWGRVYLLLAGELALLILGFALLTWWAS